MTKSAPGPGKTIDQVLDEFLADQQQRLRPGTLRKYETIVSLFKSYCESYWPDHNDEYDRVTKAGGTYCSTFGPEAIPGGYSEFLGYFMPRKVIAGKDTMQAAGTVTKKLAKWLVAKGYLAEAEDAVERAGSAAKDLPASRDLLDLLEERLNESVVDEEECSQIVEDHFWIARIEPGQLWLTPFMAMGKDIGPIPVSVKASRKCKVGWDIGGVVGQTREGWRFVEIWNVSP
jgi:hypothetical protein